jgi:uncharacterized membrane protein YqjE
MNWFHKLPGTHRSAYGLECRVLRQVPRLVVGAVVLPALLSLLARLWAGEPGEAQARQLQLFEFMMLGLAGTALWLIAALSLVCVIIWVMKGPAYVADAYDLPGMRSAAERHASPESS